MAFGVFFLTCDFCVVETKAVGPSKEELVNEIVQSGIAVPAPDGNGYWVTDTMRDYFDSGWRNDPNAKAYSIEKGTLIHGNGSPASPDKGSTSAPSPTQNPAQTTSSGITPDKAAQIQAAQQKALAANPTADPAAIYLQTLQANGYTLDATGKLVPIAK